MQGNEPAVPGPGRQNTRQGLPRHGKEARVDVGIQGEARGAHEPAQEHTPPAVRVPVSKARLAVQVLGARGHRNLEKLGQQERKVGDGAAEARSDTPPTGARHSQCSES